MLTMMQKGRTTVDICHIYKRVIRQGKERCRCTRIGKASMMKYGVNIWAAPACSIGMRISLVMRWEVEVRRLASWAR